MLVEEGRPNCPAGPNPGRIVLGDMWPAGDSLTYMEKLNGNLTQHWLCGCQWVRWLTCQLIGLALNRQEEQAVGLPRSVAVLPVNCGRDLNRGGALISNWRTTSTLFFMQKAIM